MAWEESQRGCAENCLLSLFEGHREVLAPLVVDLLRRAGEGAAAGSGPAVRSVPQAVLFKAAVYNAAAVCAYELHDYIDFAAWLRGGSLLDEMRDATPLCRPLRRAAIRLVSFWLPKLPKADRPDVYRCDSLLPFLPLSCTCAGIACVRIHAIPRRALLEGMASTDAAVALAAAATLHAMVDDWCATLSCEAARLHLQCAEHLPMCLPPFPRDFDEAAFLEFVGPIFQLTANLLQVVEFMRSLPQEQSLPRCQSFPHCTSNATTRCSTHWNSTPSWRHFLS